MDLDRALVRLWLTAGEVCAVVSALLAVRWLSAQASVERLRACRWVR